MLIVQCLVMVFIVVVLVLFHSGRLVPPGRVSRVSIDESGVHRIDGDLEEHAPWAEIVEIGIVTTSDGPFADDVFWLFLCEDGRGCAISSRAVDKTLFDRLARLEGVQYDAIVRAMGSTSEASFAVWRGSRGGALAAAQA